MPQITLDEFHRNLAKKVASRTILNAGTTSHQAKGIIAYSIEFEDGTTLEITPIQGSDGMPALSVSINSD